VKPGGLLVYVTCSVFPEENDEQVTNFLGRDNTFAPIDHTVLWQSRFPGHAASARIAVGGGISLSPALSGTDGFYFCALRKAG
jgi:16S rRNA (cytosine967-C5)-methyltransferase